MIKVSALAEKAISANSRTFLSRFLYNGTEISGDIRSVITYKGSCGSSVFTPGAIFSSYIDVVIDNCRQSLSGKELTYQIGVVIDENTTEWYDIGKYTVHKPSTNAYTTSFTALGRISAKMGMLYQSKLIFPTTVQSILDEISYNTGVAIDATAFDTSGVIEKEISGYMYREVLAIIAGIFFAYATEDSAGNIVFASYKDANVIETDGDRTSVLPTFADHDTVITGVKVSAGDISTIDEETGNEVYKEQVFMSGSVNAVMRNEFMTQALFDANVTNVVGYTYRPANVSVSLGDFRIEPFDSMQVTDSLGAVRNVPCMSIIHRFDGGITTEITAPELEDTDDSGTAFKGLLTQAVQRFQQDLISVKTLLAGTIMAEDVKATYATIESLNAANAAIGHLQADKISATDADLKYATISNLNVAVAQIDTLKATAITADSAVIKSLQADKLDATAADLKYATITNFNAAVGRIGILETDYVKTSTLTANYLTATQISSAYAKISTLEADYVKASKLTSEYITAAQIAAEYLTADSAIIKSLQTDKLDASSAEFKYATISSLNAANAEITTLKTNKLDTESAKATYATITNLNSANAQIDSLKTDKLDANTANLTFATIQNLNTAVSRIGTLETNSLTAGSAVITDLKAGIAELDTLIFGTASGNVIQTSFANAVIAQLGDAQIKSAMINSVSASKITAGDIITNNIRVMSEDGKLLISDETIRISDNTRVRVQIGKDGNNDYSINIWDSAGKLMFSEGGITDDAIKNAIIRNDMVVDNANISASKLNIDSLFTVINEDNSHTIKSTQIYMDDVQQTLDMAYKTATTAVSNLYETVNTQGTQISVLQGQITSKIWQQDINTAKNELNGNIQTLSTQYSQLEQNLSGFKSTVSGTYATKAELSADYATKTEVKQTENSIKSTVESTYQKTVSKGEQLVTNGNGLLGNNTNFSGWVFDGAVANNSPGSFTKAAGSSGTYSSDEFFPVNPANEYTFSLDAKSAKGSGKLYSMLMFYDVDKKEISVKHHIHNVASTTTLAKDLKAGDKVIYLTDVSGWSTTYSYGYFMTVWNYKNSFGYTYPAGTYSRNSITLPKTSANKLDGSCLDPSAKSITLATTYSGATIPAGTAVSQGGDGATYKYFPLSNTVIPTTWKSYSGKITGVDYSGGNKAAMFPPGTAYARIGFLWNYQGSGNGEQLWVTNLSVTDTTAVSKAQAAADRVQADVNTLSTRVTQTESSITSQATQISSLGTRMSTVEQTADSLTVRLTTAETGIDTAQTAANNAATAAGNAQSTANTARTEAAAAAKTATNFLSYDSTDGLQIGNKSSGSWVGNRAQILPTAFNILDCSGATLASFGAETVYLGKNSRTAKIDLLNGLGTIYAEGEGGTTTSLFDRLFLTAPNIYLKGEYQCLNASTQNKYIGQSFSNSAYANIQTTVYQATETSTNSATGSIRAVHQNTGNEAKVFAGAYPEIESTIVELYSSSASSYNQIFVTPTRTIFSNKFVLFGGSITGQANVPYLKWQTINSKTPYIGYASDQTDGTFVVASLTGTNYASGLAIGGGSGNLLYKGNVVLNASNYSDYAALKSHTHDYLPKTTYEYNKELAMGGSGKICIGKFSMYDSNITVKISSTTSTTYNATLVIATQNYGKGGSGSFTANVYGDVSNTIAPNIYIYNNGPTGVVEVYFSPATYSKNLVHIQCMALNAAPTDVLTSISAIPTNATTKPTNLLTSTFLPLAGGTIKGAVNIDGNFTILDGGNITMPSIELHHATPYIDFHYAKSTGDFTARIIADANNQLNVAATEAVKMSVANEFVGLYNSTDSAYSAHFRPGTDGKCTLGIAAQRWYAVYSTNGSIQTSDRREKENIMPIGIEQMMFTDGGTKLVDLHSELFDRLKPVQYNFINGNGKIAYGLIAQDVIEAMHEIGIDENKLDLVHHDFWTDEKTKETADTYGLGYTNLFALLIHEVQKLKAEVKALKYS